MSEVLRQLETRFRIVADFGDGLPPLDFETTRFALEKLIPGPELLEKMRSGASWSITRLDDEGAANG